MRITKYRAWSKVNKEMVYNIQKRKEYPALSGPSFVKHFNDYLEDNNYIVMQFTGLKDKNGKEDIYEKDVIANIDGKGNIVWKGVVEWSNEGAEYKIMLINSKEKYTWRVLGTRTKCIYPYGEVIGNVYKNPELLKG